MDREDLGQVRLGTARTSRKPTRPRSRGCQGAPTDSAAEFLPAVTLHGIRDDADRLLAVLGTTGGRVEMLFVAPGERGRGHGHRLMEFAVAQLSAREVDVNEQNAQAVGFYRRLGFEVAGRSPTDALGHPYPILHMKLPDVRDSV